MTIMSTFIARMLLTVSNKVSPFFTEEPEAEKLMVSADNLFSASSKDNRVRVEFSKNTLAIVTSRREGTFLIGLLRTSLNSLAVLTIRSMDSASKSLIPNKCGDVNIFLYWVINQILSASCPCSVHSTNTFSVVNVLTLLPT